ncbi:MAG: iron uptake porin, partial [Crocosphaera sp.]
LRNFTGTDMARLGHDSDLEGDAVINKLFYRFPIGNLTTWIGSENVEINDIFDEGNPFLRSSDTGALSRFIRRDPLTMRGPEGIGGGFAYKFNDTFTLRGLYLSEDGNDPSLGNGLFNGNFTAGGQLAVNPTDALSFNLHFLHSYFTANDVNIAQSTGSFVESAFRTNETGEGIGRDPFLGAPTIRDSYGANGNWRINETFNLSGWVGYSLARAQGLDVNGQSRRGFGADFWSWMTALSVVDFGKEGAVLSIAGGALPNARRIDAITGDLTVPDQDTPYIIETQYLYPLNDNIFLTPGFYVILQPDGNNDNNSIWVGALRTTFEF